MAMLEVSHLKKVYTTRFGGNQVEALRNVSFTVEQGEYTAIMGESGSGKTTLLNILAALDKPTGGTVLLDGKDLTQIKESQIAAFRRDNLGFVFQDFNLLDTFSLEDNIYLPLVLTGTPYAEMQRRLAPIAQQLGITELLQKFPYEVSGGQKQRAAVARALITNPRLILADEPTGNLDTAASIEIMEIFSELHKAGATVIVVTHEENIAAFTDRIIHFSDGQIIKDEINENPTKGSGKVHMKGLYRHFQKTAGTESGVVGC